ncbi:MAG: hypothetical protein U9N58_00410 [Thermodesulfobacteriota bacterium]|nr:hypothetical protein [Thermodesulfobacteriota bacterium]
MNYILGKDKFGRHQGPVVRQPASIPLALPSVVRPGLSRGGPSAGRSFRNHRGARADTAGP